MDASLRFSIGVINHQSKRRIPNFLRVEEQGDEESQNSVQGGEDSSQTLNEIMEIHSEIEIPDRFFELAANKRISNIKLVSLNQLEGNPHVDDEFDLPTDDHDYDYKDTDSLMSTNEKNHWAIRYFDRDTMEYGIFELAEGDEDLPKLSFWQKVNSVFTFSNGWIQIISFIFLILAMLSIASGGVVFKLVPKDIATLPLLISFWRNQVTFILVLPIAIYQFVTMSDKKVLLDKWIIFYILIGSISVAVWSGTFAVALQYTSLTRVYLLNNCQPLIIVVWNRITCKPMNKFHYIGVIIGLFGLLLACYSKEALEFNKTELIGDLIAFVGAIFAAIYITIGSKARTSVPSFLYLAPSTLFCIIAYGIGTIVLEGNKDYPLFIHWYKKEYIQYVMWLAVVVGLMGTSVIAIVMKYLPSLIISIVLLAEPVAASIMAIIFKVEASPSPINWAGAALVIGGIGLVMLGFAESRIQRWFRRKILKKQHSLIEGRKTRMEDAGGFH